MPCSPKPDPHPMASREQNSIYKLSNGDAKSHTLRNKTPIRKPKTKSGCSTCKTRKVKCDEGRPSCHRCVSTGRTCDGYGIWSASNRLPSTIERSGNLWLPLTTSNHGKTIEERDYFEWFQCRTATKLPGIFVSSFWNQVIFQAISDEPAVLHAILALSCVHKMDVVDTERRRNEPRIPDESERFALQQYSRAISHLQPRFSARDKASVQVALVTCIIFVNLEYLRGHYKTAQVHLDNGLRLLKETQLRYSTDACINEGFARLHVHVGLLNQNRQHSYLDLRDNQVVVPTFFESIKEARQHMDRLLDKILHLKEEGCEHGTPRPVSFPISPIDRQRRALSELSSWLKAFAASKPVLIARTPVWLSVRDAFAYRLLKIYHSMANIMAQTCLYPSDECAFDSHTDNFTCMLIQLIELRKIVSSTDAIQFNLDPELRHSIADTGWIPLLYYIALKCRNHRIRLQAVRLLNSTSHREGMWSAKMMACISRRVMEAEEQGFYKHLNCEEDFALYSMPKNGDFAHPPLPNSYRFDEVQVTLPSRPAERIVLCCRRVIAENKFETLVSEFDAISERWTNVRSQAQKPNSNGQDARISRDTKKHRNLDTD